MAVASIINIDLARRCSQLHGASADGAVMFRKKPPRGRRGGAAAGGHQLR